MSIIGGILNSFWVWNCRYRIEAKSNLDSNLQYREIERNFEFLRAGTDYDQFKVKNYFKNSLIL